MPAATAPPELLSIRAAAAALGGVSRDTVYRLIGSGELRSLTIGRRRLVPAADVADYVERRAERQAQR